MSWKNERARHSLASRGIKTNTKNNLMFEKSLSQNKELLYFKRFVFGGTGVYDSLEYNIDDVLDYDVSYDDAIKKIKNLNSIEAHDYIYWERRNNGHSTNLVLVRIEEGFYNKDGIRKIIKSNKIEDYDKKVKYI